MKLPVAFISATALAVVLASGSVHAAPAYCSGLTLNTIAGIRGPQSTDCTDLLTGAIRSPGSTDVDSTYLDFFTGALGGSWTFLSINSLVVDSSFSSVFDQYLWRLSGGPNGRFDLNLTGVVNPTQAKEYDLMLVITAADTANGLPTSSSAGLLFDNLGIEGPGVYAGTFIAGFATPGTTQDMALFARLNTVGPPRVPEPGALALLAAVAVGFGVLSLHRRNGRKDPC